MDRTCAKCGRWFKHPCLLERHRRRKTPCDAVVAAAGAAEPADGPACRYCRRAFTKQSSRSRHELHHCKNRPAEDVPQANTELAQIRHELAELRAAVAANKPVEPAGVVAPLPYEASRDRIHISMDRPVFVTVQVASPATASVDMLRGDALIDLLSEAIDAGGAADVLDRIVLALGHAVYGDRARPENMGLIAPNKKEGRILAANDGRWQETQSDVALTAAALRTVGGAFDGLNEIARRARVTEREDSVYLRATDVMAPLDNALRFGDQPEAVQAKAARLVSRLGPLFGVAAENAAYIRRMGGKIPQPGDPAELVLPLVGVRIAGVEAPAATGLVEVDLADADDAGRERAKRNHDLGGAGPS